MYKYLFGPVPSRRLGMSLGVDLVPRKVCSLDCVYCEAGRTDRLSVERKEYLPVKEIQEELTRFLAENPDPDYITFSGSGEPTLHDKIGEVISFIKTLRPFIPVAVLTNGTLFSNPSVRKSLFRADLVLPSLDAATEEVFKRINRPHPGIRLKDHISGLISFREEFKGKIWLEVFILPGYNDHPSELNALKKVIQRVNPDSIQLNTLDRPGSEKDLKSAGYSNLLRIREYWNLENTEIIAAHTVKNITPFQGGEKPDIILETLKRRPCTAEDLSSTLGLRVTEIMKYIHILMSEKSIESVEKERGTFYRIPENPPVNP